MTNSRGGDSDAAGALASIDERGQAAGGVSANRISPRHLSSWWRGDMRRLEILRGAWHMTQRAAWRCNRS